MAASEIYRLEIPIIVDDQTGPAFQQVQRKVSQFEKSAQKTNENVRRMFGRDIRIRIGAIDKVWPVVQRVQSSLRSVTGKVWNVTLQAKDKVTGTIKNIISKITSPLALLGAGAGVGAGIFYPLKLAGEMEQAAMSLEFFTESAEKGQKFLERIQAFAAKTPFEFPDVRAAAVGLMPLYKNMYGVDKAMDETIRTITAFGDAAGLTGAGINGMNLALLGFRQIGTIGKLSMEELRQVTENLMVPMDIILKELGLNGDALENLASQGIDAKTAMEAITRALEKNFAGGMEKMAKSLLGLTSTVKDTARLTVTAFGAGMAGPVRRILLGITGLTDYTGDKYKAFTKKLEGAGRAVGETFERAYNRAKQFFDGLSQDEAFQKMDWGDKIVYVLDQMIEAISSWVSGPGGSQVEKVFVKLAEIGTRAWLTALAGMVKGAGESLLQGNILGSVGLLAGVGLLGGGMLLRGVVGLGKGIFGAGKRVFGRGAGAGATGAVAETTATGTVATTGGVIGRTLPVLSKLKPWLGRIGLPIAAGLEAVNVVRAEDKRAAVISGTGRIAGMVAGGKAGAVAGGAVGSLFGGVGVAPGAVIGGMLGGIGGWFGGEKIADQINTQLDKVDFKALKNKASDMWNSIGQKANETWTWVQENVNFEKLAEGAGYALGYLEGTIFSAEWWSGQWDSVKNWTAEKWANMVEIWNSTKETINSTLFSAEWWSGQWDSVKGWTSAKWDEMKVVWENAKASISSTLFSAEWWGSKWETVKSQASEALSTVKGWVSETVKKVKTAFVVGREAGKQATVVKHAVGGILTKPHLGLVAEAGPEAVIPLSTRVRGRALALYEEAGRHLGIRPYVEGGLAGTIPTAAPAMAGVGGFPLATINLNFDLDGLVSQVVIENRDDIDGAVDRITSTIADNLRGVFQNMTKK